MPRTLEQKKADEAVTQALIGWLRAYELDGSASDDNIPRVLTDYVVFMATQGFMPDGDTITGHPYIVRDMQMPLYRAMGLAQVGMEIMMSDTENTDE